MINFSINGFGRIGRSVTRSWLKSFTDQINLSTINTSGSLDIEGWAHLLKYDTAYGPLPYNISVEKINSKENISDDNPLLGNLIINLQDKTLKIPVLAQRSPEKIPWNQYGSQVVIESTGVFTTLEKASLHLSSSGVKLVILSAPAKGEGVPTSVLGVNDQDFFGHTKTGTYSVISNASCTTNSVAPVAQVIHQKIGILKAMLTTVHGFTDDQNLQDNSHKDLRRARAASQNIVPTSTGAAVAATKAIPELINLFDGISLRVPVITGSITDFTFITKRTTSKEEINQIFIDAANSPLYKNILSVTHEKLVSSDIIGRSESSIIDLDMTRVVDGDMVKILAWYDNEWGYSNRLLEEVVKASELQ